jgi:hypothetical protein
MICSGRAILSISERWKNLAIANGQNKKHKVAQKKPTVYVKKVNFGGSQNTNNGRPARWNRPCGLWRVRSRLFLGRTAHGETNKEFIKVLAKIAATGARTQWKRQLFKSEELALGVFAGFQGWNLSTLLQALIHS